MAKLWIKNAEYLPEDWLDFILKFDQLCRIRETAYAEKGVVDPVILGGF